MKSTIHDSEKAVNVVLYLAERLSEERNEYKILKAIYRANKTHLTRYGREIFNETYLALKWGTVPALAYDIVNHIQTGKPQPNMPENVREKIKVSSDSTITPRVRHDPRALSESDIECLDEAIAFYLNMSFKDVADNAHEDAAYKGTPLNTLIPIEKIIQTLPDGERILKHLKAAQFGLAIHGPKLEPGCIIHYPIEFNPLSGVHNKFLIIVDCMQVFYRVFAINTKPTDFQLANPELKRHQVPLDKEAHAFLEYDSFVNCSQLHSIRVRAADQHINENPKDRKCNISSGVRENILMAVKTSKTLTPEQKESVGASLAST